MSIVYAGSLSAAPAVPGKEGAMIRVNGEEKHLENEITLQDFLEQEGYQTGRIAVEKNGGIVPKSQYAETLLHSGDVLEIVSFVGGG